MREGLVAEVPRLWIAGRDSFTLPKTFWEGQSGVYDHERRVPVVDDARSPFALETACCIDEGIRAMFVPGSRDSLPRPLPPQKNLKTS